MTSIDAARERALEARGVMLSARPKDPLPPLPDGTTDTDSPCLHYFLAAASLYSLASQAFAQGDPLTGYTYELWAFQHMVLGEACQKQSE